MSSRPWPIPDPERTFHLVGDVQGIPYLGAKANRAEVTMHDMTNRTIPHLAYTLQVGDFCSSGPDSFFPPTIEFMDTISRDGQWHATIGNHDKPIPEWEPDLVRSADEAAALIGMPNKNYVADLGYAVLIVFFIRAWGYSTEEAPDTAWLAATLDQYPDRTCMVMVHPPLRQTIRTGGADMLATDDTAIRTVLDTRPQARLWLCGHTHSPLFDPIVKPVSVGSRSILQVNASALLNQPFNITNDTWDPLRSLYVTVHDDRTEVRFRDHGAQQWIGGSQKISRAIVVPNAMLS